MSIVLYDLIFMIVFSCAVLLILAARTENIMAEHYINNPCLVRGKIKELCKATLPARRETRASGFDYAVVEYEWNTELRTAKLMRTKKDYESRVIELAVDRENPCVAVRREYETPKDIGIRYFICFGVFLFVFLYGNFVRNLLEAVVCGAALFYFRRPLILHIYDSRKEEWQGTSSIVNSDGGLPPKVIFLALIFSLVAGFAVICSVLYF